MFKVVSLFLFVIGIYKMTLILNLFEGLNYSVMQKHLIASENLFTLKVRSYIFLQAHNNNNLDRDKWCDLFLSFLKGPVNHLLPHCISSKCHHLQSSSDAPKTQLCSSDSPPLCRCGERVGFTEDPASGCCCCLEELDRSMATSSSTSSSSSSSSISRSRSSSGSTSGASLRPHRSEVPQKVLHRVGSDSAGLRHFLDISNDFLCIPVLRDGHSVQSATSSFMFAA